MDQTIPQASTGSNLVGELLTINSQLREDIKRVFIASHPLIASPNLSDHVLININRSHNNFFYQPFHSQKLNMVFGNFVKRIMSKGI